MICPLSPAHFVGLAAFHACAVLLFLDPALAPLPLAAFLLCMGIAPFLTGVSFFLPITTRGKRGERGVSLTFDDGPDPEVTPRVLDVLDTAGARASFFCIGRRVRAHPGLCRDIVARGHRVENHGDSHSSAFAAFGYKRMQADIAACQATIADVTGQSPRFFRPTAGLRSPLLDPVLARLDLRLATWTRRGFDTRSGDPHRIYSRLAAGLAAGDILLLHDGHAARTVDGRAV
ncbi:MAG: polysaccharide deacetylase family protein, partial [Desulfobacteraceae bacterium]